MRATPATNQSQRHSTVTRPQRRNPPVDGNPSSRGNFFRRKPHQRVDTPGASARPSAPPHAANRAFGEHLTDDGPAAPSALRIASSTSRASSAPS
jgi:hypothetical protein